LTGAKARAGRAHKTRADLEQQLKACRRELTHARESLAEAMKQKTATSEVMRIISSSPIQSVLDAVAENAARLCEANNAEIFQPTPFGSFIRGNFGEYPCPRGPSRNSRQGDWTSHMRSSDDSGP
jgi:cobalamin biosynthesis protein CbiD